MSLNISPSLLLFFLAFVRRVFVGVNVALLGSVTAGGFSQHVCAINSCHRHESAYSCIAKLTSTGLQPRPPIVPKLILSHAQAEASWSTGVDKTFPIKPTSTIIDFSIGPIPFKVTFEIPLTIQANAMMHAIAEAQFGVVSQYVTFCMRFCAAL